MVSSSRFIIGIDLGTTNIALSYIDTLSDPGSIRQFKIPQLINNGELIEDELLPACCCFPALERLPENALALPWQQDNTCGIGLYALKQGSAEVARQVRSAKSWLCHAGVDRTKNILPWMARDKEWAISPLNATAKYLAYLKDAWDYTLGNQKDQNGDLCLINSQQLVITVPASFDECARELTLEAAEQAGLKNITLLEEPLAAFYSYLSANSDSYQQLLTPKTSVLLADIGGGTTDFSLIELDDDGVLNRTAAGNHLLLGGDNIDIAIAKIAEQKLGGQLSPADWAVLCQQGKEAKEKLLSDPDCAAADIVLLAKGSSLIGDMKKTSIERAELDKLLFDGFFPAIEGDAPPAVRAAGIRSMNLPYEQDAAVTKHLLDFLRSAAKATGKEADKVCVDYILFNGGTMIPAVLRERVVEIVSSWHEHEVKELPSENLNLAVSNGAAYYGLSRRGEAVQVKSGTTKAFYLELAAESRQCVCVMPRGAEENNVFELDQEFTVTANCQVLFPLLSSSTRINDQVGDTVEVTDEFSHISQLNAVLLFGQSEKGKREIKAKLTSTVSATGILAVKLHSLESDHQWPLKFDVRLLAEKSSGEADVEFIIEQEKIDQASALINEFFSTTNAARGKLNRELEQLFELQRKDWPLALLRSLSDILLELPFADLPIEREAAWLNLTGYCLRPGFGHPEDEIRIRKVWKIWYLELKNKKDMQANAEWWIFWRRVAAGLSGGHQRTIYQNLLKEVAPKGVYSTKLKPGSQLKAEMWRVLGSLERLTPAQKEGVAKVLLKRINKLEDFEVWTIGRLGSRKLFHAPANLLVSGTRVNKWVKIMLESKQFRRNAMAVFALLMLAQITEEREIDITAAVATEVKNFFDSLPDGTKYTKNLTIKHELNEQEQNSMFGEKLPLGLQLKNS